MQSIFFSIIYNFYEINSINRLINIEYQDLETLEDDQDIYITRLCYSVT